MRVRRAALAAVSSVLVLSSGVVAATATNARADVPDPIALPAGPDGTTAYAVTMGAAEVYALWGTASNHVALYVAPDDGTGSWQPVTDPTTGNPVTHPDELDDGVVLERIDAGTPCSDYRVITPTTAWTMCAGGANLGNGGKLVATRDWVPSEQRYVYQVYDALQGTAGGPLDTTHAPPALDGTWVWTAVAGQLAGHDTASGTTRTQDLGDSCRASTVLAAVGDPSATPAFATVRCQDGGVDRYLLADLTGAQNVVDITGRLGLLRNGFLYGPSLRVQDLSRDFTEVDYPGVGGVRYPLTSPEGWLGVGVGAVSGAASGEAEIAYLTTDHTVDVVRLPWLGTPPTTSTDSTPPTINSIGGSPGVVRRAEDDTAITLGWSGQDDEISAPTYDVQVKDSVHARDEEGWQPLSGAQGTFATTAVYDDPNQSRVCLRVRATDRVGNHSSWSTPRCTSIDAFRPWMRDGRSDHPFWWRGVLDAVGRQSVAYRFHGTDDVRVASYDVQERGAPNGGELGRWHDLAGGLTGGHLRATIGVGQEKCFRARARDQVGRVSGYGDRWCAISPLDDHTFAVHGGRRVAVRGALGGSVTKIPWHGPSVTHAHLSGRSLAILARSDLGGCPRVWWGGHVVMSRSCAGGRASRNGFTWYLVQLRRVHHGTVRVAASVVSNWTEVDAVAVGR